MCSGNDLAQLADIYQCDWQQLGDDPWEDGKLCGLSSTCWKCRNCATYWYSKAMTACGSEGKWGDGKLCGLGTSCKACLNSPTYWYKKAMTACGAEPKWADGKLCALGTSCNACANKATWWPSKVFTACGSQPASLVEKKCPKKDLKRGCCCMLVGKWASKRSCAYCPGGHRHVYPGTCGSSRQCRW